MESNNAPKKPGKSLFKKGQVANPNGRPVGSPNKITTQMRETMHDVFMNNKDKIQQKMDALEDPKDWLNFMAKLFPYFMPSMTATKVEKTIKHTGLEHLGSKELHQLLLTIKIPIDAAEDTNFTEE